MLGRTVTKTLYDPFLPTSPESLGIYSKGGMGDESGTWTSRDRSLREKIGEFSYFTSVDLSCLRQSTGTVPSPLDPRLRKKLKVCEKDKKRGEYGGWTSLQTTMSKDLQSSGTSCEPKKEKKKKKKTKRKRKKGDCRTLSQKDSDDQVNSEQVDERSQFSIKKFFSILTLRVLFFTCVYFLK